jgi:hypothetical protein
VAVSACPKSVITGDSLALIEEFQARRAFGDFGSVGDMPARSVDAFQMLEQLLTKERSDES